MESFYDIFMFQRLLSRLFEPEGTPSIEVQLREITRQVASEYGQGKGEPKAPTDHRGARRRRRDALRQERPEAAGGNAGVPR